MLRLMQAQLKRAQVKEFSRKFNVDISSREHWEGDYIKKGVNMFTDGSTT